MKKLDTIITSILTALSETKEAEQASSNCLAASGIAND
tara:strand:- start:748 stop:861 length:114 start_codon:yes stop_codon:yes gene_type:complete